MLLVHEASGSLACVAAGTMTRNEGPSSHVVQNVYCIFDKYRLWRKLQRRQT